MAEPWYLYAGFIAFVIAMLLVDLKVFHAEEHEPEFRESAIWAVVWIGLAVVFGVIVFFWKGGTTAGEYFAGFLIEKSLSVDNMFVFIVIFSYFRVPPAFQHQVLFYGILGAMIFRGIFIAAGVALIENFEWIIYVFGVFLIITAVRIARGTEEVNPEDNPIIKMFKKRFPTTTRYDGQKLFTIENGKRVATPLFVTLLFIEITDIVFAVDSIPAIFAITKDPFIILTSNVFAILGLRALYFLLAGSLNKFHLLKYGLSVILAFVGVKMLLEAVHVDIPIWLSLTVIISVLTATVILSLKLPAPELEETLPAPSRSPLDEDGSSVESGAGSEQTAERDTAASHDRPTG